MSIKIQTSEMTLRDWLLRIVLVIGTVAIIVWFMPRDHRSNFKFEKDKIWRYSDLVAPFDFPIYKSEDAVQAERDSLMQSYEPYYDYVKTVEAEQVGRFMQDFKGGIPELRSEFVSIIANQLHSVYTQGIINKWDFGTPDQKVDSMRIIRIINGKKAVSVRAGDVLTTVQAYEKLFSNPLLAPYKEALQKCNLNNYIAPNIQFNNERSEASKADLLSSIPLAKGVIQRGQKIIDRGEVVGSSTYDVLVSFQTEIERRHKGQSQLSITLVGQILYVLLFITAFTLYLSLFRNDYFEKPRSTAMLYSLIIIFSLLAALLVSHSLMHVFILPFTMVPIFIRVFMDSRTAFFAHAVLILIVASMLQRPLEFVAVQTLMGIAAIFSLRELSSRSQLFWTAVFVTVTGILVNVALEWVRGNDVTHLDSTELTCLIINGLLLFCSYPLLYIIEKTFGFTSNITLIELSDMNKEVLRRMSEVAPGTFQHSIQVGNLAAEIARKIGAKSQLVRTGALYHDIGKIQNPIYFTENQSGGVNPHERLDCIESAQMIISHVTEGLKLADKYNLPTVIREFIATHHGQGKAKFFFVKYKNEHPDEEVDELLFTYPGPNPFTKEQAILMMADAVEAASRSLPDYTEQTIRSLVNRIIDSMVTDGYFRECPITFRDIQYAKTVLIEKLKTIYHTRISYPELNK